MIGKIIGNTGFMLVLLGVGCMDSPSMLLPATMISVGAVLIAVSARLEEKWTEK